MPVLRAYVKRSFFKREGVGKGSCFQFTLPIKPVDVKVEPVGAAKVKAGKVKGKAGK